MTEVFQHSKLVPCHIQAVFFDLDGTLLDTAPDIGRALNQLRQEEGLEAMPQEEIRPHVSYGSKGIVRCGFGKELTEKEQQRLHDRLIGLYAERSCSDTQTFPYVADVLGEVHAAGLSWGVVTNKTEALAVPVLNHFSFFKLADCLVFGDTLKQKKPCPEPLLYAAEKAGVNILRSVYVGDGKRDIEAAKSAGCFAVAAAYGYEAELSPPEKWGADTVLTCLSELSEVLLKLSRQIGD